MRKRGMGRKKDDRENHKGLGGATVSPLKAIHGEAAGIRSVVDSILPFTRSFQSRFMRSSQN
jgi:hypothetical protein